MYCEIDGLCQIIFSLFYYWDILLFYFLVIHEAFLLVPFPALYNISLDF